MGDLVSIALIAFNGFNSNTVVRILLTVVTCLVIAAVQLQVNAWNIPASFAIITKLLHTSDLEVSSIHVSHL